MPAKEITFNATYAGDLIPVKLSPMLGEHNWHLYVGNFYCGSMNLMSDGWHLYLNDRSQLDGYTADDRDILLDMITQAIA